MQKNKQTMPAVIAAALVLAFGLNVREVSATIYIIDQSNTVGSSISLGILPGQSLGQSFTPSLTRIDEFDIQACSVGTSTVELDLLNGSTTVGTPFASTPITVINNATLETVEFQFPSSVSLVPGGTYTARLDLISGSSCEVEFSSANPYAGGVAFDEFQYAVPSVDWVFSEGLTSIPEPSSALLLGLALVGLTWRRITSTMSNERVERTAAALGSLSACRQSPGG